VIDENDLHHEKLFDPTISIIIGISIVNDLEKL
jgi:hypothetical protein